LAGISLGGQTEMLGQTSRETLDGAPEQRGSDSPSSQLDRWMAERLLTVLGRPAIALRLWDGRRISIGQQYGAVEVTVCLHDRGALYRLLNKPTFAFGELYTTGRLTVDGDLVRGLEIVYREILRLDRNAGPVKRFIKRLVAKRPNPNTLSQSRENIHTHYDLGNDFYKLWLDDDYTQYTCAYYPTVEATLDQAQAAKLEHVCRKLALKPGDSVVEAGGGWGGLARYMVRHYGVTVRSYNISKEQVAYARERAERDSLGEAVEYIEDDYRNMRGDYDVFVSVGMLEHVGPDNYRTLGATIDRVLKDDGRGLIHSIGRNFPGRMNEWIESYIFPGAYPPTLREMMEIFEPQGFSIVDIENLRSHYARTLIHWRERYEANLPQVREMFDEDFVRAWYLYLSGSISAFTKGQLQLFQVLFQRPACAVLPPTRDHLYREQD